ncbi:GGDEF domain-containing protein [Paenibacillus allorhizosphaerae]|uniref:GGDEF domain-containing protein n=1 Tax=Paenibacillus allorhizosphaerae TaxID=2849866 RepID=A0ABM8VE53_9BACL|nr:GGDEF domain-containing protein [Paenibacillus allorhizosphaerae]CAG7630264.1 hypothetical protein PAECIP111802_01618 [Paenibacillus allorhizosphaerae]
MNSTLDRLTGLLNRKELELRLKQNIKDQEPVALALIDIDHFMEINNQLGDAIGDEVLKTIAAILAEEATQNIVFRVSGDEFAIMLTGVSLEQAFLKMESIRATIYRSGDRFRLPSSQIEVSVTAGVAQFPRDAKDEKTLMRSASAALLSAKESGRNQVALPPNEEMIMKTCYYPSTLVRQLKTLSEKLDRKESSLFREALTDLIRKYDQLER